MMEELIENTTENLEEGLEKVKDTDSLMVFGLGVLTGAALTGGAIVVKKAIKPTSEWMKNKFKRKEKAKEVVEDESTEDVEEFI